MDNHYTITYTGLRLCQICTNRAYSSVPCSVPDCVEFYCENCYKKHVYCMSALFGKDDYFIDVICDYCIEEGSKDMKNFYYYYFGL